MGTLGIILLVAFIIVCVLLVLLVLVQDDGQNGMGGLLGGRGTAAFGSHSASVLTKATAVFVILFFVLAFSLALLNKKKVVDIVPAENATVTEQTVEGSEAAEDTKWFADSEESKTE